MKINFYKELEKKYEEIYLIHEAKSILRWDEHVMLPLGAHSYRTDQYVTLQLLSHQKIRDKKLYNLIKKSERIKKLNIWEKKNLHLIKKHYTESSVLDDKLIEKTTRAQSDLSKLWLEFREKKKSSFKPFIPKLEKLLGLIRIEAKILSKKKKCSLYDVQLDHYEMGLKSDKIDVIFDQLISFLPDLLKEVLNFQKKKKKIIPLKKDLFPDLPEILERMNKKFMCALGFNFLYGRLDVSVHPFCGGTYRDVRITTRYEKNYFDSLMAVLHETGHAFYNLGTPEKWKYQAVGEPLGMAVHESQSLFWEMQVCRSYEFLKFAMSIFEKWGGLEINKKENNAENFYKIFTKVKPSFIRVNADEVTYPLHVILRYKIEKELIEGNMKVKDIPKVWNMYMKKYLGITPKNNLEGCLQDTHWFDGTFGYFPTYTLGALYAAQFFAKAKKQIPSLSNEIAKGKFTKLLKWLRDNIHQKGSLYTSDELIKKVTGEELNIEYFKNHLVERYLN